MTLSDKQDAEAPVVSRTRAISTPHSTLRLCPCRRRAHHCAAPRQGTQHSNDHLKPTPLPITKACVLWQQSSTRSGVRKCLTSARSSPALHTHASTHFPRRRSGASLTPRVVWPMPVHACRLGRALKGCAAPERQGQCPYCTGLGLTARKPPPGDVTPDVEAMCSRTQLRGARSDAQRPGWWTRMIDD